MVALIELAIISHFSMGYSRMHFLKNRSKNNRLLILTHHLKGLSLSFQKIIKLTNGTKVMAVQDALFII